MDENHAKEITSLVGNSRLNVFATSSVDKCVKVWDALDNTLIREISFSESVWSVEFLNSRADLIVGLDNDLALVRVQDFMPFVLQRFMVLGFLLPD